MLQGFIILQIRGLEPDWKVEVTGGPLMDAGPAVT